MRYLKIGILFLLCVGFLIQCKPTNSQTKGENTAMDLYLCIGQSNMAGRADYGEKYRDTLVNVFLFTGDKENPWEKAANPLNKYSTVRKRMDMQKMGPSYGFAKEMAKAMPTKKIGLIVNAKGGTAIAEWKPGETLYNEAVKQAKQAMTYGTLKGIIWHQGEADSGKYNSYMPKITELIAALRKDLNAPDIPFVAGQLSPAKPKRKDFNNMILGLPEQVANTGVVTTENTVTIDSTHFDSDSQRLLGERYAIEMLKLINEN